MKLSIIIPLYNQEKRIIRALDSIQGGNGKIEIVVVDDASTDNSYNVVEKYKEQHPNKNIILLRNEENIGVGLTYNKAHEASCGEYICILCSDDYYLKPIDVLLSEIDGSDLIFYDMEINSGQLFKQRQTNLRSGIGVAGASKLMRREFVGDLRRTPVRLHGDVDFFHKMLAKKPVCKFTEIVFYHYDYPREDSLLGIEKQEKLAKKKKRQS